MFAMLAEETLVYSSHGVIVRASTVGTYKFSCRLHSIIAVFENWASPYWIPLAIKKKRAFTISMPYLSLRGGLAYVSAVVDFLRLTLRTSFFSED